MVKFRLKRMGSKFNAFYRVVVTDSRSPRDSKFIDAIGYYNPHTKEIKIDNELREKWYKDGARPTDTVKNLFKKYDALKGEGIKVLPKKKKKPKKKEAVITEKETAASE